MKTEVLFFSKLSLFIKDKLNLIKPFVLILLFTVFCSTVSQAQIFFDGSPGTAAPPATLGGYTMVPFGDDVRPTSTNYSDVPLPAPYIGVLEFSPALNHRKIGDGWASWSHGYTGSVYATDLSVGVKSMTFTLPCGTRAFYFYAEPNQFGVFSIEAIAQDGTSSGPIPVEGLSGAKYFGFYTDGIAKISQIVVTAQAEAEGFAVGEFGIFMHPSAIVPADEVIFSCDYPSQALIDARFASWLTLFEYEGGCDPTEVFVGTPKAPLLCEGGVETVTYVVTDPTGTVTEVSTFTVNISDPVAVTGPLDETVGACDFANQQELDEEFIVWLNSFGVIEAGCGVETPTLTMYSAPALCTGGAVTVVYSVSDICTDDIITRTFTVTPPPALVLSKPADETYSSCQFTEQAEVDALFASFLTKFQFSGGCQPIPLSNVDIDNPMAPDWQCGGIEVVYYTVTDANGCNVETVSATFTVTPPPPVVINTPDPKDYLATSCDIFKWYYSASLKIDPVQLEFDNWVAGFSAEGSCEAPTLDWEPKAPGFGICGGSVTVTFTATDDRCYTEVITATFTIEADDPIEFVQLDKDFSDDACNYEDQKAVDVAFYTWLDDVDVIGGCSPTIYVDKYEAPSLCDGGTVTVTWTAYDLNKCVQTESLTATFTIIPPDPLTFTPPADIMIDACTLEEYTNGIPVKILTPTVETVFNDWMDDALTDLAGGCSPTVTHDWDGETYPERCAGGHVTVTWTISDLCEEHIVSATFTLMPPPMVLINIPVGTVSSTCEFESQDEVDAAFASWLEGFGVSGGCDPQGDYGTPSAPALSGGSVDVYYEVTDLCVNTTVSSTFTITPPTELSGIISYYNYFGVEDIPMPGTLVELLDDVGGVLTSTFTDVNGYYEFNFSNPSPNLLLDTENVRVSTDVPFGGLSATDALAVWLVANGDGNQVAYWTPETFLNNVGNVDGDDFGIVPGISILDVTRIMDRLLYPLDPDFFFEDAAENVRNWTFYAPDLNINFTYDGENAGTIVYDRTYCELDILVRPFGDVLGNYSFEIPTKSDNQLQSNGVIRVDPGNQFDLPVQLENSMEFSAMTLVLDYDKDNLEVIEVQSELPGMRYAIEDGTIRVAWASLDPVFVEEGQDIIRLVARTLGQVSYTDQLLVLNGQTSFGDRYAVPINDFKLSTSSIDNNGTTVGIITPEIDSALTFTAYPNPFRNELNLAYELSETSNVSISIMNMLGAEVAKFVDRQLEAGSYTRRFTPDNLDYGIYFVRFDVKGETTESSQLLKLVYIR